MISRRYPEDIPKMEREDLITFASLVVGGAAIMWLINSGRGKRKEPNTTTMDQKLPRGYRNNNPLNIRLSSANIWQGEVSKNTDGIFEQFVSMEYGYRAALKLLRNYITKDGLTTVAQIINKWAPSSENNTAGYIQRVCQSTGWVPGKTIDPYNVHDMTDLVYAMALVENGTTILPDYTQIYKGWEML